MKFGKMLLSNFTSRKFLAFVVATMLLIYHFIDGNQWLIVLGIYLGVNILESGVNKLVNKSDISKISETIKEGVKDDKDN